MIRVIIAVLILFSLAVGTYWYSDNANPTPKPLVHNSVEPDYTATNLKSIRFDESGRPIERVEAKSMQHYAGIDVTYFSNPVSTITHQDNNTIWRLSANEGTYNLATELLLLENNVIIRSLSSDEPIQQLTTEFLKVNVEEMKLTTHSRVNLIGNKFTMSGKGLEADLNTNQIHLLADVKGNYEAQ